MNDNKKIVKNSGILFGRLIITTIVGLISTRILLDALGISDFGLFSVVGGVVSLMGFFNTVMISTTFRFIAVEMGKGKTAGINKVFNISLVIHCFLALLLIILSQTIGVYYINHHLELPEGSLSDALIVFKFSMWSAFFTVLSVPFQGLITANENFLFRASTEVLRSILKLVIVFFVAQYIGNRLEMYSFLMFLVMALIPIMFFVYTKFKYPEVVKLSIHKDKSKYKEMLAYSVWIMVGASAEMGKVQVSALIINSFFGTLLNAAWGIAAQVQAIIKIFANNIGQAAIPQITKSYSGGDKKRSVDLSIAISKVSFFLMFLPALPILLEIDAILSIWLKEIPDNTIVFVKLMVVFSLIEVTRSGLVSYVLASGKIKWFVLVGSTVSLLALPIAWVLFTLGYPPYFIVVAYICTAALDVLQRLVLLRRILSFDVKRLLVEGYLKMIIVVLLTLPVFYLKLLFPSGMVRLIFFSLFATIYYMVIAYIFGFSTREKELVKSMISNIKILKWIKL